MNYNVMSQGTRFVESISPNIKLCGIAAYRCLNHVNNWFIDKPYSDRQWIKNWY